MDLTDFRIFEPEGRRRVVRSVVNNFFCQLGRRNSDPYEVLEAELFHLLFRKFFLEVAALSSTKLFRQELRRKHHREIHDAINAAHEATAAAIRTKIAAIGFKAFAHECNSSPGEQGLRIIGKLAEEASLLLTHAYDSFARERVDREFDRMREKKLTICTAKQNIRAEIRFDWFLNLVSSLMVGASRHVGILCRLQHEGVDAVRTQGNCSEVCRYVDGTEMTVADALDKTVLTPAIFFFCEHAQRQEDALYLRHSDGEKSPIADTRFRRVRQSWEFRGRPKPPALVVVPPFHAGCKMEFVPVSIDSSLPLETSSSEV